MRHFKYVALLSSSLLLFSGCSNSSSSSSTADSTYDGSAKDYTQKVTGKVIDGYIKNARMKVARIGDNIQLPVYVNGVSTENFYTTSNGGYTFYLSGNEGNVTLTAANGIDSSTGESFEGSLETVIIQDSATVTPRAIEDETVSPLTTLVAKQVNSGINPDEAKKTVAAQLGIDETIIKQDVIELMKTGTPEQRAQGADAWKKGVTVQKIVESYSKSIGGTNANAFEEVSKTIYSSISTLLSSGNSLDNLVNDSTLIATQAVTDLKANEEVAEIIGEEAVELIDEKIDATKDVAAVSIKTIFQLDITKLVEATDGNVIDDLLENSAKSIEMATQQVEEKLAEIAEATDLEVINTIEASATKIAEAINELGGVSKLEELIVQAKSSLEDEESTIDISEFTDKVLTDEILDEIELLDDLNIEEIAQEVIFVDEDEDPIDIIDPEDPTDIIDPEDPTDIIGPEDPTDIIDPEDPTDTIIPDDTTDETDTSDNSGDNTSTYSGSNSLICIPSIDGQYTSSYYNVSIKKAALPTQTGNLSTAFANIESELSNYLDVQLTYLSDFTTDTNTPAVITFLITKSGSNSIVAASTKALFGKDDNGSVYVSAPAGEDLYIVTNLSGSNVMATKRNTAENLITSSGDTFTFNPASIFSQFANHPTIGNTIKEYFVNYATKADSYRIYMLINKTEDASSLFQETTIDLSSDFSSLLSTLGSQFQSGDYDNTNSYAYSVSLELVEYTELASSTISSFPDTDSITLNQNSKKDYTFTVTDDGLLVLNSNQYIYDLDLTLKDNSTNSEITLDNYYGYSYYYNGNNVYSTNAKLTAGDYTLTVGNSSYGSDISLELNIDYKATRYIGGDIVLTSNETRENYISGRVEAVGILDSGLFFNIDEYFSIPTTSDTTEYILEVPIDDNITLMYNMYSYGNGQYVQEGFYVDNTKTDYNISNATPIDVTTSDANDTDIVPFIGNILSGVIKLPDGEVATSDLILNVASSYNNGYTYYSSYNSYNYNRITIPEGSNSAEFSLGFPTGVTAHYLEYYFYSSNENHDYINNAYYTSNGTTTLYSDREEIAIGESNITDIEFEVIKGTPISGTISIENNTPVASSQYVNGNVEVRQTIYYSTYSTTTSYYYDYFTFTEGEYSKDFIVNVPHSEDYNASYQISYYIYNSNSNYYTYGYYVDDTNTSLISSDISDINITSSGLSDIQLTITEDATNSSSSSSDSYNYDSSLFYNQCYDLVGFSPTEYSSGTYLPENTYYLLGFDRSDSTISNLNCKGQFDFTETAFKASFLSDGTTYTEEYHPLESKYTTPIETGTNYFITEADSSDSYGYVGYFDSVSDVINFIEDNGATDSCSSYYPSTVN